MLIFFLVGALLLSGCGSIPPSGAPSLVTDGETLYLAGLSAVYAVGESGVERWKFPKEGGSATAIFSAQPALSAKRLYVGNYDQTVYALDLQSGEQVWQNKVAQDRIIGGVTFTDSAVIFGVGNRDVIAIDRDTGGQVAEGEYEVLWQAETDHGVWTTPLLDTGRVYVASLDHHMYALEVETGEEIWKTDLSAAVVGTPVLADGILYAGTLSGNLYALDAETGEIRHTFNDEGEAGWFWGGPAYLDGRIFAGDLNGMLYVLDAQSFEIVLKHKINDSGIGAAPLVTEERIYVPGREGSLHVGTLEEGDGVVQWVPAWRQPVGAPILTTPVLFGEDMVVVSIMSQDTLLKAFVADTGVERWAYPTSAE
jgi:outer membrane protein assembly factor BamB